MASSTPWLSLIMPTRDGARYLEAALNSVASQWSSDLELLIIDDGSTDETLDVARRFARHVPLRIVQRQVGNWTANTNLGMRLARGRYIGWLHQDDLWRAGRVTRLRDLARRFPEAELFIHPAWFVDGRGVRRGLWKFPFSVARPMAVPAAEAARRVAGSLLVQNWIAAPATMFRADAARRVGYLDERLWYAADWDFWLRLSLSGSVMLCPEALACFRVHPGSQTVARGLAADDLRWQYARVLDRHLARWQRQHPGEKHVAQAARFSVEMNLALGQAFHGRTPRLAPLLGRAASMSRGDWAAYLRHSTLRARCLGRLLARLGHD